jgi:hypothetical protein
MPPFAPFSAWLGAMSATARLNSAYWRASLAWWRALAAAYSAARRRY